MSLRVLAESDLSFILEDGTYGFGWDISLIAPDGQEFSEVPQESGDPKPLLGFSDDISSIIDPDTGQAVSGRLASVALRESTLRAIGIESLPKGISERASKPWVVKFNDIQGKPYSFKVSQSNPDRALGVLVLLLESYRT